MKRTDEMMEHEMKGDALLKNATEIYICQHIQVLEESVRLVLESKNAKTREDRYELVLQHFSALSKIRKYVDKNQKKGLRMHRTIS